MKLTKSQIDTAAYKALASGNPYIAQSTVYYIDNAARFIFLDGHSYTKAQLDEAYLDTAKKDIVNGFKDRMAGYYDKWYRYTRADEGRAYDFGSRAAAALETCPEEMYIIPCMH